MKRTLPLLALVFTLATARADLTIEQQMESTMMNGPVLMKVKGDKMRMDMNAGPAGAMSTIMDLATGDMTTLMHAQKMAMKVPGAQAKQMMEMMKQKQAAGAPVPKLTPTGKSEKIGNYNAEIYTWSTPNMTQTLWVAKDFPNFAKIKAQMEKMNNSPLASMGKGAVPDMNALPGMVVKTQVDMAGQKITTTLVSVKEENVDPAVFQAPADYQEIAQPGLPGGTLQTPK